MDDTAAGVYRKSNMCLGNKPVSQAAFKVGIPNVSVGVAV